MRTALITGGVKRIGRAITLELASKGVNCVIHYRKSSKEAANTLREAHLFGVRAWAIQADLSKPGQSEALFKKARQLAGSIDVLINNASVFSKNPIPDLNRKDLAENFQIHAHAPLILSQQMAKQKRAGCIVNILDTRISRIDPEHPAYWLSKRMLYDLTRVLAVALAPGIRVNAVAPGAILPPPGKIKMSLKKITRKVPLQHPGTPEDIARAVLFLADNPFITGQVLFVDGGENLRGGADEF